MCCCTCLQQNENDPMIDAHILIYGFGQEQEKNKFEKRALSLKNSSPDSKVDFSEKLVFGIWTVIFNILRRYDIILDIWHIILNN